MGHQALEKRDLQMQRPCNENVFGVFEDMQGAGVAG